MIMYLKIQHCSIRVIDLKCAKCVYVGRFEFGAHENDWRVDGGAAKQNGKMIGMEW